MRTAPVRCQVQAGSNVRRWSDEVGVEQQFDDTTSDATCTNSASFFVREASAPVPQTKVSATCAEHTEVWLARSETAYVVGISVYVIGEEVLTVA